MKRKVSIRDFQEMLSFQVNNDGTAVINGKVYGKSNLIWIDNIVYYDVCDCCFFSEKTRTDEPRIIDDKYFYLDVYFRFNMAGDKYFYLKRLCYPKHVENKKRWWNFFSHKKEETSLYSRLKPFFKESHKKEELDKIVDLEEVSSKVEEVRNKFLSLIKN